MSVWLMRNGSRVGVFTTPKLVRQGSNANVPCTRYWHQGFGVIMQGEVVAFTTHATAVRVAAQATANTKIAMTVVPVDGIGWGYRRA
jgi:hypothetical protein